MMNRKSAILLTLVLAQLVSHQLVAQTTYTTTGDGDWVDSPTIWDQAGTPGPGDIVIINHNVAINWGLPATVASVTINDGGYLWVNEAGVFTVTGNVTINSSSATGETDLATNADGRTIAIGGNLIMNSLNIAPGNCEVELNGGTISVAGNVVFQVPLGGTVNDRLDQNVIALNVNTRNPTFSLGGNVNDLQAGQLQYNTPTATLELTGSVAQVIPSPKYTGGTIPNLIIDNTSAGGVSIGTVLYDECPACAVTAHNAFQVTGNLDLQRGVLNTGQTMPACGTGMNVTVGSTATITRTGTPPTGGAGLIQGAISKLGDAAFTIPATNGTLSGSLAISDIQGGAADSEIRVEFMTGGTFNNNTTDGADHVGDAEYWNISNTCGLTDPNRADVTIGWANSCASGIHDVTSGGSQDLFISVWDGTEWVQQATSISGTSAPCNPDPAVESGSMTVDNATVFGRMGFASLNNDNTLPITLTEFTVSLSATGVLLEWTTLSEESNKHFEVQRSVGGQLFETIATLAGQGTTVEVTHYTFTDAPIPGKKYYYRLKQVDFSETFSFSGIKALMIDSGVEFSMPISPNPIERGALLNLNCAGPHIVTDSRGRILASDVYATFSTDALEPGVYIVYSPENKAQRLLVK